MSFCFRLFILTAYVDAYVEVNIQFRNNCIHTILALKQIFIFSYLVLIYVGSQKNPKRQHTEIPNKSMLSDAHEMHVIKEM
jgi:hypothetical protein